MLYHTFLSNITVTYTLASDIVLYRILSYYCDYVALNENELYRLLFVTLGFSALFCIVLYMIYHIESDYVRLHAIYGLV